MKSKFFLLTLGLFCLANATVLTAQNVKVQNVKVQDVKALKITPKKANFVQDEGIVLNDTKLSTSDADALIALLKANPAAGYLQVVDAKGNVQTYGTADINAIKLKGTAASSLGLKSSGGLAAATACTTVIIFRCAAISDKSSMMFKAQTLLNSYK